MRKIPSLFIRDWAGNPDLVTHEVDPVCAWVLAGEGRPTRKWDGTACRVTRDPAPRLWKRYDAKGGKAPPPGFEPAQESDAKTGHWPGWVLVGDGPEDRWHREGWLHAQRVFAGGPVAGTYELIGPKVGGNPEGALEHMLIPHGDHPLDLAVANLDASDAYDRILNFFLLNPMEGIVWRHFGDGRMAKAKARDFGLTWPARVASGTYPGRILV